MISQHPRHHASAIRNRGPIADTIASFLEEFGIREGKCLEVASGTGAHLEAFCQHARLERFVWQPSEFVAPSATTATTTMTTMTTTIDPWKAYGKMSVSPPAASDYSTANRGPSHSSTTLKPSSTCSELELLDEVGKAFPGRALPAIHLDLLAPLEALDRSIMPNSLVLIHAGNVLHVTPPPAVEGLMSLASFALRREGLGLLSIYGPFTVNGGVFTTESNREFHNTLVAANENFGYRDVDAVVAAGEAKGLKFEKLVDMPANNFLLLFSTRRAYGERRDGGGRM